MSVFVPFCVLFSLCSLLRYAILQISNKQIGDACMHRHNLKKQPVTNMISNVQIIISHPLK